MEGYRAALGMISYQGRVIWDSFRTFLAANTIIAALAGALLKLYPNLSWPTAVLSSFGIIVCLFWIFIEDRAFKYQGYWFAWARHYEKRIFGSAAMIQMGQKFAQGHPVFIDSRRHRVHRFKVEALFYGVLACFVFIYGFLIFATLSGQSTTKSNGTPEQHTPAPQPKYELL